MSVFQRLGAALPIIVCTTAGIAGALPAQAATITIVNLDGPGEGFNDSSPVSPIGGNAGVTLGQQRLNAFQFAVDVWGALLTSNVEITVAANFDPLSCDGTGGTLGLAAPTVALRDFSGAPQPTTFYPVALANKLAGTDLCAPDSPCELAGFETDDVIATFSSTLGTDPACSLSWYYGLDANASGSQIDLVTVVLHEFAHGFGFASGVDLASGSKLGGFNDAFILFLEDHSTLKLYPNMTDAERVAASVNTGNLHWVGPVVIDAGGALVSGAHPSGHVEMYAPNPVEIGSSASHFSTSLFPNDLLEPFYIEANHNVDLTLSLLLDVGWGETPSQPPPQPQSKEQQQCINAVNKGGAKVAAKQGKENAGCVKNAGKGKTEDAQACLTTDAKGKVAKAAAKNAADEDAKCSATPDFGFVGATVASQAARNESVALVGDVFGGNLDAAVIDCNADKVGCKCQAAVIRAYEKTAAKMMKEFLRCSKNALEEGAGTAAELQTCVTPGGIAADADLKIAVAVAKLRTDIAKRCVTNVFPGLCASEPLDTLHACINERLECRVCLTINAMDSLNVNCDVFDDGTANLSCSATSQPPVEIACGQTVLGVLDPTDPDLFGDTTFADLYLFTLTEETTVRFTMSVEGFDPFLWIGDVNSVDALFQGDSPQEGTLPPGDYVVIANNLVPLPAGSYPYELSMVCSTP